MSHPNVNYANSRAINLGLLCIEDSGLIWILEKRLGNAKKRRQTDDHSIEYSVLP